MKSGGWATWGQAQISGGQWPFMLPVETPLSPPNCTKCKKATYHYSRVLRCSAYWRVKGLMAGRVGCNVLTTRRNEVELETDDINDDVGCARQRIVFIAADVMFAVTWADNMGRQRWALYGWVWSLVQLQQPITDSHAPGEQIGQCPCFSWSYMTAVIYLLTDSFPF